MKKIFTLIALATLIASCHIQTPEPEIPTDKSAYEAYGLLTITSSGFTKQNVRTQLVIKDDATLDLYMYEVKFAEAMPVTIDMLVQGVSYEKVGKEILFYGDSIVPTAGNKPYEKYIIRELEGKVTADSILLSNYYGATPSVYAGQRANK